MKITLTILFWSLSLIANAQDDLSIKVNNNASSFVVSLDANPSTGFQWSVVHYDKTLLTLNSSQYQMPKTKLIGAGGQMLFTFGLNKDQTYPEKTNMQFKYARSWEPNTATTKNVTVLFVNP